MQRDKLDKQQIVRPQYNIHNKKCVEPIVTTITTNSQT